MSEIDNQLDLLEKKPRSAQGNNILENEKVTVDMNEAEFPTRPKTVVDGVKDDGFVIPPDTMGAIGPNHILSVTNSRINVKNKANGTLIQNISLSTFLGGSGAFDPVCHYDTNVGRFFACGVAGRTSANSKVLVMASKTIDPSQQWNRYSIQVSQYFPDSWADFPRMGYNKNWLVVTANMFSDARAYTGVLVLIYKKIDLVNGVSTPQLTTRNLTTSNFTLVPSRDLDNTSSAVYLAQIIAINSGGNGIIKVDSITGTTTPVYTTRTSQYRIPPGGLFNGLGGPQLGTDKKIDTGDFRLLSCVFRKNILYTAHNHFTTTGYAGVLVEQFNTLTPTAPAALKATGLTGTAATQFAFPSISVNSMGHAMIGMSMFSSSKYASAAYSIWRNGTASITYPIVYQNGLSVYIKDFGSGEIRWGDYSDTVIDPGFPNKLWTIQEYADTGGNWGTVWKAIVIT